MVDEKPRSALARAVLARRTALGLSQIELARRGGISRSTVAAVELDKYPSTDTATLMALAKGLGMQPTALLGVVQASPIDPAVDAFLASPWNAAVSPTEEDLAWLRALPEHLFAGKQPTPEAIAKIILWRREHLLR